MGIRPRPKCLRAPSQKFVAAGQFSRKRKSCGGEEKHRVYSFCLFDYLCNIYETHVTFVPQIRRHQAFIGQPPVFGLKQLLDFRKRRMNLRF